MGKPAGPGKPLSAKQDRFVEEFLKTGNATQAADLAGYAHPNKQGPRLLVNVGVAAAIAAAKSDRSARVQVDMDYVLSRLVIEAEREDEKASHAARVSALKELRSHLSGDGGNPVDHQPFTGWAIERVQPDPPEAD